MTETRRKATGQKRAQLGRQQASANPSRATLAARQRHAELQALIELDAKDLAILELHLAHPYLTQRQIGTHERVQLSRNAVRARMQAPKFKRALAEAARPALDIVRSNQAAAARRLGQLLHDPDARVALRAAIAHLWPLLRHEEEAASPAAAALGRLLDDACAYVQHHHHERREGGRQP